MAGVFCTIVNGAAGGGRCRDRARTALDRLRDAGVSLDVHYTERPGHARELARDARRDGQRRFLAVGGDGTAFEIVDGLFSVGARDAPCLGMLPLGTGNSFLRDFGILGADAAVEALASGRSRRCDVLRVRHRDGSVHCINLVSLGFTAQVGALTNTRFKPFGHAGYLLAVLVRLAGLRPCRHPLRVDDADRVDDRDTLLLSFCNSRYTGGAMMMAPGADVADGALDVVRVGPMPRRRLAAVFPRIFKGTHGTLPEVEQARARAVTFEEVRTEPVLVDGEILQLALERIEVVPGGVEVVA